MGSRLTTSHTTGEESVPRYGVLHQTHAGDAVDQAVESIRLIGYAVVHSRYDAAGIDRLGKAFDHVKEALYARHGGRAALAEIDEHNTIRAPLALDRTFLELACDPTVLAVAHRLIGDYIVLNQQNGIVNPPGGERYNQAAFHRDLPFQHFVSSRSLAVNALFCLDEFSAENGATCVVPGSHKQEAFPSDATVRALQVQVSAPAGSFIVLDGLLYHSGGVNRTERPRRAVNHLYTVPIIRPQLDLPGVLGDDYTPDPDLRRLLGYELRVPASIEAYYAKRRRQLGK